ncbi:MAG: prepilin-type N-terminal cleavage/methylation domain-containing protein [Patescibacteria group bacterium]
MRTRKGFTLIELLVVIAIIGLLATLAVVALNNARTKSRDAKRVSDIKQIQTALELYYSDQNKYPTVAAATLLGSGALQCLGTAGWGAVGCAVPYMGLVPSNPTPNAVPYTYSGPTESSYTITFSLESGTGGLSAAMHTATPSGVQ